MKIFVAFFAFYIVVEALAPIKPDYFSKTLTSPSSRIYGGEDAEKYQFPYQAFLQEFHSGRRICGGVVISENHILTSALCLLLLGRIKIVLGLHDRNVIDDDVQTFIAKNHSLHPDFNISFGDDIAVIRLDRSINFKKAIKPVALPEADDDCELLEMATVSGWGYKENKKLPKIVRWTSQRRISADDCTQRIVNITDYDDIPFEPEKMLCTANANDEDTYQGSCWGDHGGPLTLASNNRLIGISSWDLCQHRLENSKLRIAPSVYTKVCKYKNWILQQMKEL